MNIDLDGLTAELAEKVASRVLAELAAQAEPAGEPWCLLDVEGVAVRLGRSGRWVRERVKRGDLPYVRLDGGGLAFELDDVRAFARARRISCSGLAGGSDSALPGGSERPRLRSIQKAGRV